MLTGNIPDFLDEPASLGVLQIHPLPHPDRSRITGGPGQQSKEAIHPGPFRRPNRTPQLVPKVIDKFNYFSKDKIKFDAKLLSEVQLQ